MENLNIPTNHRDAWNKGKLVGQKAPLRLRDIWAIRIRLQLRGSTRDLALFNLAIDSKLRACDLVKLRVRDVAHADCVARGAIVLQQLAASLTEADAASGHKAVALDAATLAGYVGHYQLAPDVIFTIVLVNGQLLSQLTGQDPLPIYASAKDKFFLKVVDAQIDFERDASGHVVAMVLHQSGADQRAKRTGG